jgi:uncharacterized protein (DUF1015 family)
MAIVRPFRALRPRPEAAADVAAVPYDVVDRDEARRLADGNPLSFLHVSRAEIDLPDATDPYSDAVYRRAVQNFDALKTRALVTEDDAAVYFYRLRMGAHEQTGLAACFSLGEYDGGVIKKHERTRRDKEDDRTRHMLALGAQTGPVFLTYRADATIDEMARRVSAGDALFDFNAPDGVQHTVWRVVGAECADVVRAAAGVPAMYIADGHHRAASAARARDELLNATTPRGRPEATSFLAVAFPHSQVQILPYNRIVMDLAGLDPSALMNAVAERFEVTPGPATPAARGEIAMYLQGQWLTLTPRVKPDASDAIAALDVSVLQDQLLAPILRIGDVRTDKRIDFVGGARGTAALELAVNSGRAAVAFSLFPVSVGELMTVSDAGAIMPPKSTWFEPKLRDGLLIHVI